MSFTVVFNGTGPVLNARLPVAIDLSHYKAAVTQLTCDSTKINPIIVFANFVQHTVLNDTTHPVLHIWSKQNAFSDSVFQVVPPKVYSDLTIILMNKQLAKITSLKNVFVVVQFNKIDK